MTILNLKNLNNCLPKTILLKIITYVHFGIYPSKQFIVCMFVCKAWKEVIPRTLKTLIFENCNQDQLQSIMFSSILKQDYNESLENIIINSPSNYESVIKILTSLTMPFFCKSSSILYQPPLKSIEISSVDLGDRGIELIGNLLLVYNIRKLVLKSVQLNDNHMITISKSLKLNHFNCLEQLDISFNHFTRLGLEFLLFTLLDSHKENQIDNIRNSNIYFNSNKNSLSNLNQIKNNSTINNISVSGGGIGGITGSTSNNLSISLPNQALNNLSNISLKLTNSSISIRTDESDERIELTTTTTTTTKTTKTTKEDNDNNEDGSNLEITPIDKLTNTSNEYIKTNINLSHKPFLKCNLKSLDLSNNKRVGLDCITLINDLLPRLPSLKSINLSGVSLCTVGLSLLIQFLKSTPTIKNVNLSNNGIYPNGAIDIGKLYLRDNTTLRSIDLSENKISLIGVQSILNSISGIDDDIVSTSNNNNNNNNSSGNGSNSKSRIKSLYLRRTMISFRESLIIRNLIFQTCHLKILDLSSNQINSESMTIICESLSYNKTIENLNFSFNLFGVAGCQELSKSLIVNKTIKHLHLHCVGLKKQGAQILAESLRSNNVLTHLYLSNNEIKSSGCSQFSKLLKVNQTLKYLDISCNYIKNKGAIELSKVLKDYPIQIKVDINGNNIKGNNCKLM